jgi:hypothetical protein
MAFLWLIGISVVIIGITQFCIHYYHLRRDLRLVTQSDDSKTSVIMDLRKINSEHLSKQFETLRATLPKEIEDSASETKSVKVDVYKVRHPKNWSLYSNAPKEIVTASLIPENIVYRGPHDVIWKTQDTDIFVRHNFSIEYQYRCSSPNPYAYGLNTNYWAVSKEEFNLHWSKIEVKLTEI